MNKKERRDVLASLEAGLLKGEATFGQESKIVEVAAWLRPGSVCGTARQNKKYAPAAQECRAPASSHLLSVRL